MKKTTYNGLPMPDEWVDKSGNDYRKRKRVSKAIAKISSIAYMGDGAYMASGGKRWKVNATIAERLHGQVKHLEITEEMRKKYENM